LPSNNLPMAWLKGATTQEEKEKREVLLRNSTAQFTLLLQVLQDRFESIERKGFREEDYSDQNWVFLQAFRNGQLAMLTDIAELFNFMKAKE
jgi:hypothetical protein